MKAFVDVLRLAGAIIGSIGNCINIMDWFALAPPTPMIELRHAHLYGLLISVGFSLLLLATILSFRLEKK